jgi:large subunit ribosomal protein L24
MQKNRPVKKPGKQRKMLYNAPQHIRQKIMAAPLSPELIASKSVKSLPIRKGDTIQITRGDNKGFEGKINRVDLKRYRIFIEGLTREKVDGTNIFISVHPSKVVIKKLNLDDRWRKAIIERKKPLNQIDKEKKVEKKARKTAKKSSDQTIIKKDMKTDSKTIKKKNLTDKKVKKAKKDKIATKKEEDSKTIKKQSSKRKTKLKTK